MAHNYLQLSLDVVRALVGPENAQLLQLNASQCGALKMKLQEAATNIQDFVDSLSPIDRRLYEKCCKTVLQEFYRVVKDAEAIIHSCCDKNWLQAAIKLANNTEAFVDVIFKLDWCTAVLGNLSRDVIPGERNLPKYFAASIAEVDQAGMMGEIERMLRVDAMDDRKNLRRRLGELQNGTEALDLHPDIILHLLRITDPAAEDEQKTEKGDFLLTIEPKELRKMQLIGAGAFAVVYKINWLGQSFAGKYNREPLCLLYLNERKILADLCHPHVAQIFGCTISDPCCLVMELMHTDLLWHIECFSRCKSSDREALFELPVAVDIMLQIAEGMEYLHRKRIVHRDLNPSNILINPVDILEMADAGYVQAKLTGFSVAEQITCNSCFAEKHVPETCSLRECFSELECVGTTIWMAPELERYESSWGNPFKPDVYSYALTCCAILTGKFPFDGTTSISEARARTKAGMRPTLPASLPKSLSFLIERCWDTDASMRPPFFEICAELRRVKYLLMSVDAAATCEKCEQDQWGSMFTNSEVSEKPEVDEIEGRVTMLEAYSVGESDTSRSMVGKGETNEMATGGEITSGSMFVELGTPETLSGGELRTCGSKLETHAMPTIDEIRTRESRIEKLGTHYMPMNFATLGTNFLECQHESGPQISFCWRVGDEDSTLELVFRSAESMSRVVGLGLEFAKVVVSTSTWEVKIIGIGQKSWEVMWTELTGLDKNHKVGGILSVKMMGGGLQDDLAKEYLGGIESAQKYGVGLSFANNRAYVQFTNVLHERDHCLVLHKIVEYLMLEKVDLAKIGNQCAVSGEAGSSSRGANNSDQVNNDGTWIGQMLSNFRDWLSKGESKSNGDNEDNRSPSNKEPPKVEDESASKNTCKITVRPRAGGSFMDEAGGQFFLEAPFRPLNGASIDPTLVFVFDKNGSFGKQILVTTTTSFDLGKSAPPRESNGSFGWYHNLLLTSLRNVPRQAVLETTLCKLLMENPKDTKSSVKQIDTHSSASTSERSIAVQVGIHSTHIGGHSTGTETGGKTSAREAASENPSSLDMWRGFIYRDLSAPAESSACYDFDCSLQSPTLELLKDRKTRSTYMGSGMCGAVRPTFVGAWSIVPDDTTEDSKYAFEAERTLKHLYKIGEEEKEHKTIQKYDVEILVNHAMTHLCNVKGDHVLRENDSVLNVMTVSKRRERKWLQYPF
ncbi:unnamed protein product [Sphagnum jensenii]|uniref:Protein kinase domain-containing protein n=1 Tax=Sphagnum jensenii TaxID=128206 RepID=A0ABP1A310_9BRYO